MIRKKTFNSEEGITLVELIVAMAISMIALVALTRMFDIGNKTFYKGDEKAHNQMDMSQTMIEITRGLRYAKDLEMIKDTEIPTGKSDPTIDGDRDYKYLYINKKDGEDSIVLLEYDEVLADWIEKKYLEEKVDTDTDNSYFILNKDEKSIKFEIADKSIKYGEEIKHELETTINLLNAEKYPPVDPNPPNKDDPTDRPQKYKGIKYKE